MRDKLVRQAKEYLLIIEERSKKLSLPGLDNIPLYDVAVFFFRGLLKGAITTRASAVAFSFYLAIFPAIIFVFTLIPYIPVDNFQENLISLLQDLMPTNAYLTFKDILEDIITQPRGGLLSFGFVLALLFSTNGFSSLIDAFNATYHDVETRSWFAQRLISIYLVIIIFVLSFAAVLLITLGQQALELLLFHDFLQDSFSKFLFWFGKWVVVIALLLFAYSFLYYLGPVRKKGWRFISAGSTLATVFSIIISIGFSFYINNFGNYNTLYGSIGTILVILMWLYLNSVALLIGFELNASIRDARSGNSTSLSHFVKS